MNPPIKLSIQKIRPLQGWVHAVNTVWAGHLGRKFPRYVDSTGAPVTDATRFPIQILRNLEVL